MISVIMSTYKESELQLRQSIESILNQTYEDFEYIIILDCPDNQLHKTIIESYKEKDPRVRFYINEMNIGLANSLNKGIQLANGEFIARMDADDISLPDRFKNQLKYIQDKNYDLIGGITQMIDENGDLIYSIQKVPTNYDKIKKILKYGQCIAHPTWFGKKVVFETLNGYREIPLCEDYDFTLRAVLSGYRISNLNKIVLQYRMTNHSISRQNLFEQYLYMTYITKQYKQGKISDIEKAKKYVEDKNDLKQSKKYLQANILFNSMLREISQKKLLSFVKHGFQLVFTSRYYLDKIFRFVLLSLNS
ncbi:capsular polysaccharide synthesis protein CpsIbJ [Faecalicoccus pleomorphus]|uniref:Capsular polysaccharide synthesis protein CpsIbJ n=2 Tax=Faecalicoccus pleomorphus TaxID=1323 RepID=A0A380LLP3_9FIRM|nr:glycosyltransferase [Faecalicoccus pleomorphus]SUO04147.1 capsular polysaccharide synthesis protein CpsIbJ [Faecalicoccus pleomorphus]